MPSHHDDPHHRRGSHSIRRRHVITPFGHPYACTPALNAIFQHTPTPSHSQVTTIIQQTGLKRKQITSWFWRKPKESIDQEQDDSLRHVQGPKRSSSQSLSDQTAASRSVSSAPQIRSGRPRDQEQADEEYRPPSHVKITPRSHHRSTDLNPRPSSHPGRAKLTTTVDGALRTNLPSANQNLISPSVSSKPKSPLPSSSSTSPPQRSPILIRCTLRPLSQRLLNETFERQPDGSNGSNKSEFLDGCPEVLEAISTYDSSSIKPYLAQQIKDSSTSCDALLKNPGSSSVTKQSSPGTSISSAVSSKQNPNDEVLSAILMDHLLITYRQILMYQWKK